MDEGACRICEARDEWRTDLEQTILAVFSRK